ncbi:unnamed protein product [Mytilus coruscus]|uniref:Mutator-like transposase domain-containing protein n=1 Tax=Mytilus coruscus TaxID=42192 RepID=A0A6J8B5B3_MYTCO|nr:unnamed protein product [Mytilus coruscus]
MGWQKRGSGKKYDSMSGVGVAIGNETGKVLEREIRSKNCRTCSYWEGKGVEAAHHDCPRNWYGTSKGMEPDVGVSFIKKIEEKNCTVSTLIMHDDATTMSKIRQNIDHDITKWSDIKHVQNSLEFKKKKLDKKRLAINENNVLEIREGDTYKTEIDMLCQNMQETDVISNPLVVEELNPVQNIQTSIPCVYFDLETTSLSLNYDIVQISAVNDIHVFDQYITPSSGISKYASEYPELKSHKQEVLVSTFLKKNYSAHNASADVQMLKELVEFTKCSITELSPYSFTTTSCALCLKQNMVSKTRLVTLKPLTERSVISTAMAKKI